MSNISDRYGNQQAYLLFWKEKIVSQNLPFVIKRRASFLLLWILILFIAILLSVYVHEVAHGFGAKLQGVHVSTGFNQVGDYGKSPDDPDFRSSTYSNNILGGLLGPAATWTLAVSFTIWLYRFTQPSLGAVTVSALAITNGLVRAVPMLAAIGSNLVGRPIVPDEVTWGIWVVVKYCQPPGIPTSMGFHDMLVNFPCMFYREPIFWIAPLISLTISLACLILSYLKTIRLWRDEYRVAVLWLFALLPVVVYYAFIPLQDVLDRLIRINW